MVVKLLMVRMPEIRSQDSGSARKDEAQKSGRMSRNGGTWTCRNAVVMVVMVPVIRTESGVKASEEREREEKKSGRISKNGGTSTCKSVRSECQVRDWRLDN